MNTQSYIFFENKTIQKQSVIFSTQKTTLNYLTKIFIFHRYSINPTPLNFQLSTLNFPRLTEILTFSKNFTISLRKTVLSKP